MTTTMTTMMIMMTMMTMTTSSTCFTLVVDDFGIWYQGREQAQKLFNTLRKYYVISVDWTGSQYCGHTLDWNYDQRIVDMSMPGYVEKAVQKYQYQPMQKQDAPHEWTTPVY